MAFLPETVTWKPEGQLAGIVQEKEMIVQMLEAVVKERADHPLALRMQYMELDTPRGKLYRALRRGDGRLSIIAELKRTHPGETGREQQTVLDYDERSLPVIAKGVEQWDTDALMVWTDRPRYGGDLAHLRAAAGASKLPLIRADYVLHPLQVAEAALSGCAAVLIVAAACLPHVEELLNSCTLMGLEAVVECHTNIDVELALDAGATMILCSNLDRASGLIVPGAAERIREKIPDFMVTIAGGGISSPGECHDLLDAGFDSVLLGRTLFNTRHGDSLLTEIRRRRADMATRFFRGMGFDPNADVKDFDPKAEAD